MGSSVELASAWGIPNHPIRRAMVCHAVFGPGHRFLRRACWLSGFVQTSAGMNNSNASLSMSELDEVDKSLGYSASSNRSSDGLPCGFWSKSQVPPQSLLVVWTLSDSTFNVPSPFHSSQFLEELLHALLPAFRKGLKCHYDFVH